MSHSSSSPLSLRIVATIFFVIGVVGVYNILQALMYGRVLLEPNVLGLFIGIGLLRLQRGWRTCALIFLVVYLLLGLLYLILTLTGVDFYLLNATLIMAWLRPIAILALTILNIWMIRVLLRDDIETLFGIRPQPGESHW